MPPIHLDVWLYGPLARYGGAEDRGAYAHLSLAMPEGTTLEDLLKHLGIPSEERGIVFVSGALAAFTGLDAGLDVVLKDGDRVGIFHSRTMWPFQYRFGAAMTPQLAEALRQREDGGIRHAYRSVKQ
ncbi:MAG: MoaD/ThiS family protein [Thermoflexales bacterium]|nr:MoaD/ThiS family protein [Thermoflexales bacterium]